MAYGLSPRAFIETGPADQVTKANPALLAERPWRALSETCRLAVIEQALRPANDHSDGYPVAL